MVWLDKTIIHRLVSFIAALKPFEVHYMDTNPAMFSSKTFISLRLKKEIQKQIGWLGDELIIRTF